MGRSFRQLDVRTGDVRLLFETPHGVGSQFRTWIEPNGRAIHYNAAAPAATGTQPADRRLQWTRRDLDTSRDEVLMTLDARSVNPSPDGRYLGALHRNPGPLSIATLATRSTRRVWAPKDVAFEGGGMAWAPS